MFECAFSGLAHSDFGGVDVSVALHAFQNSTAEDVWAEHPNVAGCCHLAPCDCCTAEWFDFLSASLVAIPLPDAQDIYSKDKFVGCTVYSWNAAGLFCCDHGRYAQKSNW